MKLDDSNNTHAAGGAALGFLYQSLYALRSLVLLRSDDASVVVERLDDVELKVNGETLLYQLKHSISANPPAITLKSRAIWQTIRVWVDALPSLKLAESRLHLVAVGPIPPESPLVALTNDTADRSSLVEAMTREAERVMEAREDARKGDKKLPYSDRVDGCSAFLALSDADRINLLRRAVIQPNSPTIIEIEREIADYLDLVLPEYRASVAKRLVEWWDRQVIYSMCGTRERMITRAELQSQVMEIVADLERGNLVPEFESRVPPDDYQPDSMLARQIHLVKGMPSDITRAVREEWRARTQRGNWTAGNPAMRARIAAYDSVLCEHWADRHEDIVATCAKLNDDARCEKGLALLRWTHFDAPNVVQPIAVGWVAPYYVRGSFQVLAIDMRVGWHPDFHDLLKEHL